MKRELALLSILLFALHLQSTTAQCPNSVQYSTTFKPACSAEDLIIHWPDYTNSSNYYVCNGIGNPAIMNCAVGNYFCYVRQSCGACSNYLPPVECKRLPTEYPADCVAIGNVTPTPGPSSTTTTTVAAGTSTTTTTTPTTTTSGLPTPNNPPATTTTTSAPSTTTTTTGSTTTTSTTTTTTTTTTPDGIPPPPSPSTDDPNVPAPPTPTPTPPTAPNNPPTIGPIVSK